MKLLFSDDQQSFQNGICFLAINDETNECVPVSVVLKDLFNEQEISSMKQTVRQQMGTNVIAKSCRIILDEPIPKEQ